MYGFFKFSSRHPVQAGLIVLALTLFFSPSLRHLRIDISSDVLIPAGDSARKTYDAVREDFGTDETAVVYAEDDALFSREKLEALRGLTHALQAIPGVTRVDSLFTAKSIDGESGFIESGPIFEWVPDSEEAIARSREKALRNPLMPGNIISRDARATLLTLYLDPGEAGGDPDNFDNYIYRRIEEAVEERAGAFGTLFQTGAPAVRVSMAEAVTSDQRKLLPLAALVLIVLIGASLRNPGAALMTLVNAAFATVWTFGIMVMLGIPVNMLNYIVPALIFIVGATEDVHYLTEYIAGRRAGKAPEAAIDKASQHLGLALALTALTTALGFSASVLTDIPALQQFGVAAGFGMVFRFLATVLIVPLWLRLMPGRVTGEACTKAAPAPTGMSRLASFIMKKVVARPRLVLVLVVIAVLPALFMAGRIRLDNDILGFLSEDSPVVRNINLVAQRIAGGKIIYLTHYGAPGEFRRSNRLQQLRAIRAALLEEPGVDTVTSIADHIALVNREMRGGNPDYHKVPDSDRLIAQYMMFFHPADTEPYVTHDYSKANMVLRCNINNSTDFNSLMQRIRARLDSGEFGPTVYTLSGRHVLVNAAVDRLAVGQMRSVGFIVLLLFGIVATLFLSIRCGILAMLANLFSIAVVFGIMGWLAIPLNVGTCMIAAITLGICVDNTLHLMVRYNRELKNFKHELKAIEQTLSHEMLPVMVTSFALAAGFALLSTSSFVPVRQFGILSALAIIIAAVAAIVLIPVMLSKTTLITLWDVLGFKLRETLRQRSSFFNGMTNWQVKKIILLSHLEEHPEGATVIRQGEEADTMYVIIEGNLRVIRHMDDIDITMAELGVGDATGEMALLAKTQRTADVIARTDVKILAINWESLRKLRRYSPYLASQLFLNLAGILGKRFVDTEKHMTPIPFARVPGMLPGQEGATHPALDDGGTHQPGQKADAAGRADPSRKKDAPAPLANPED